LRRFCGDFVLILYVQQNTTTLWLCITAYRVMKETLNRHRKWVGSSKRNKKKVMAEDSN